MFINVYAKGQSPAGIEGQKVDENEPGCFVVADPAAKTMITAIRDTTVLIAKIHFGIFVLQAPVGCWDTGKETARVGG